MKAKEFFEILEEHKDKSLLFEYAKNLLVGANYHITEVKHIAINSVDCGANTDNWNETLIQLWESPTELGKTKFMTVFKALAILKKVGGIKSYDLDSEIKFEYGNATFHTTQLFVNNFEILNNNIIFKLAVEKTDCKAKEACGIDIEADDSKNSTSQCTPGGGCC